LSLNPAMVTTITFELLSLELELIFFLFSENIKINYFFQILFKMTVDIVRSDPRYLAELERQLELKEESLKKLTEILAQKEELLLATSEKLCQSEKRKVELVTIFESITFSKIRIKIMEFMQ